MGKDHFKVGQKWLVPEIVAWSAEYPDTGTSIAEGIKEGVLH